MAAGRAVCQCHAQLAAFDRIAAGVGVRTLGKRSGGIQESAGARDDGGAAVGVVALAGVARRGGNGVGAVERVVQAAPARVGGVQRVARIRHRHDQLRAGLLRDFGVDVVGRGLHAGRLRQQIGRAHV
ncbi:hypothetical protein G6F35_016731 [Rhizopus arrhizus]|nr:hypothetical protein G6F35_016731 [Rhizopus arrhizus]